MKHTAPCSTGPFPQSLHFTKRIPFPGDKIQTQLTIHGVPFTVSDQTRVHSSDSSVPLTVLSLVSTGSHWTWTVFFWQRVPVCVWTTTLPDTEGSLSNKFWGATESLRSYKQMFTTWFCRMTDDFILFNSSMHQHPCQLQRHVLLASLSSTSVSLHATLHNCQTRKKIINAYISVNSQMDMNRKDLNSNKKYRLLLSRALPSITTNINTELSTLWNSSYGHAVWQVGWCQQFRETLPYMKPTYLSQYSDQAGWTAEE